MLIINITNKKGTYFLKKYESNSRKYKLVVHENFYAQMIKNILIIFTIILAKFKNNL